MKRILAFYLTFLFILGFTFGVSENLLYADEENTIEVYIDIKPGACPNYLSIRCQGFIQVAILGTPEFDVSTIDPIEIELEREGFEEIKPVRWTYEDVATPFYNKVNQCDCHVLGGDGYVDLVLKFETQNLVNTFDLTELVGQTVPLTLTGELREMNETEEDIDISGQDCLLVIDQRPPGMKSRHRNK